MTPEPRWRVSLPPGIDLPTHRDNLVYQAARRLFEHVGIVPPGLHLSLTIDIPLARGLGSSSSAIVGGLVAANHLIGNTLDRQALLAMAVDLEGHPDNVTPALMGADPVLHCRDTTPLPAPAISSRTRRHCGHPGV